MPAAEMAKAFQNSSIGQAAAKELAQPPERTKQGVLQSYGTKCHSGFLHPNLKSSHPFQSRTWLLHNDMTGPTLAVPLSGLYACHTACPCITRQLCFPTQAVGIFLLHVDKRAKRYATCFKAWRRVSCPGAQEVCTVRMEEHEGMHAARSHPGQTTQFCVPVSNSPGMSSHVSQHVNCCCNH